MTISLSGQSVLVVGAGGGIGRATLEAFARQGAKVTAAGRPGEALSAAAAAAGVSATPLDFLDNDAVEALLRGIRTLRSCGDRGGFDQIRLGCRA
jgi:2-keto-3-deoxy-L-fuconate dehydrogenase